MPTDNPKISLYVPQQIYNRFKEFQKEQGLSMSQAGIVILAEYFGIEETIKEITQGTTVGGVSLDRIEKLEQRFLDLENKINSINFEKIQLNIVDNKKLVEQLEITSEPLSNKSESQLELLNEPLQEIHPFTAKLLGTRFGMGKASVPVYKSKKSPDEFQEWTKGKDPDNITWIPNPEGKGYVPKNELPSELKNRLLKWIEKNN